MPPKKQGTVTRYRDAGTGEYITRREAERRPSTTVRETDKIPKRPAPPKKRGK